MPTDPKTVEAYNAAANDWAAGVAKSPAHRFLEKPAMMALVPNLAGKDVLTLGCGSGEECAALSERGARVVGTDISEKLVAEAHKNHPQWDFRVMDMEKLDFSKASFDFVYSSLALHYLSDWKTVLTNVRYVLRPGGSFLFSIHHPLEEAASVWKDTEGRHLMLGFTKKKDGTVVSVGDYLGTRSITDTLHNTVEVTYWHRPFSAMVEDIVGAGFEILALSEPKPTPEAKKHDPAFWEIRQKMPLFALFHIAPKR